MAAPAKFLFDVDFGAGGGARDTAASSAAAREAALAAAAHEAALAEAEARGYRNGMAAAEAQARTEAERRTAAAYEQIGATLASLQGSLAAMKARYEAEAVEVAVAVAKKLAAALTAREPVADIAALADGCLRELMSAPHVVVRVHEGVYAQAKERLEDIVRNRGFQGRLVVMGEADIGPGDCRIEWADGGLVHDRTAAEAAIDAAVERYVAHRRGGKRS